MCKYNYIGNDALLLGLYASYGYRAKSSLSKSMQLSIPPIGRCWTFSTSQVDLTHSDDYHYCIEVKTIVVKLIMFTIVTT